MIDLDSILGSWNRLTPEAKSLADVFVSPEGVGRRYLLGRNEHSAAMSKVIDIDGFVDDFAEAGAVWHNKPVMRGGDVPLNAIIVNCSMSIRPISAHKRIKMLGVAGCLAYADLCKVFKDLVPLPNFVAGTRSDILRNRTKWEALRESLFDDKSKQVLDDVLNFRLTGDYRFMRPYTFRPKDQYFEDFLGFGSKDIFVDAGGFDGDTTEEFCKRYPDYQYVFFFEPSSSNCQKARTRLMGYQSIKFLELGLSDSVGTLWFNPNEGSASAVSESGSCQINVTTLDREIERKVTFIKMDLEGWEIKALEGSRRHILEDHPKLAIAVYHKPSDFWRIFEFIIGLRQDYNIFLRHYSEGWSETVMYFVPR